MTRRHVSETYGQFEMAVHENVLHAKVYGSLDAASMNAATNVLVPLVNAIDGSWASLMDYREWELYTDDMIPLLLNLQKWLLKNGHSVEVAIVGKSGLKKTARERLLQQLDEKPEQVFVETEEEGWQWLIDHNYCHDRPPEEI